MNDNILNDSSSSRQGISLGRGQQGSQGLSGVKKVLTIKPLKQQPKIPENYDVEAWKTLERALEAVYRQTELLDIGKEELYRVSIYQNR